MKLLFVRLSSIGDIVHALPALARVRRAMPDSEIAWAVDSRYIEILRGNSLIDHLIEIDMRSLRGGKVIEDMMLDMGRQIRDLRSLRFDVAVDLQGLLKSATLSKFSGAKTRWGFSKDDLRETAARVFYTDTVQIPPKTHVVRKNLLLVENALDLEPVNEDFEFPIFTSDEHKAEAKKLIQNVDAEFAMLNPAGGWVTKLWHAEKFGALADMIYERLGIVSAVAIGPNEDAIADTVVKNSRCGKTFVVKPSLKGFYELAKLARIYVGGDTGPTHIAVAAGTPVVGIFGPTEWWRNGSVNPDDICVERNDIDCRVDCHRRTCSNWICMDIDVETVFRAVGRRLETETGIQAGIGDKLRPDA